MPYQVLADELTVLEKIGEVQTADGKHLGYEHRSVTYLKDEILDDSQVSPVVTKLYNEKDPHTRKVLRRLTKAQLDALSKVDEEDDVVEES